VEPQKVIDWDRSHDWIVERTFYNRLRVSVRFAAGKPSVAELVAVRRCFPQFANMPPQSLLTQVGHSGALEIGTFPATEARHSVKDAQQAGLNVVAENASYVIYVPVDRTLGCAMLIEDDGEARATAEAMIAAGVPVNPIEVD
jgi:hypothetical protein